MSDALRRCDVEDRIEQSVNFRIAPIRLEEPAARHGDGQRCRAIDDAHLEETTCLRDVAESHMDRQRPPWRDVFAPDRALGELGEQPPGVRRPAGLRVDKARHPDPQSLAAARQETFGGANRLFEASLAHERQTQERPAQERISLQVEDAPRGTLRLGEATGEAERRGVQVVD